MRMPILPRWVLTNPLPAFYDIESTTSVQMTAKVYKYVQSFAEDYNKFADEINKTIEEFVNEVNADQECFEAKITKIVHDYIITIDAKIEHQDREIAEAIEYMKTNLSQAIQDTLNTMIENGELSDVITEAMTEISTKLNTLEPKVLANETNITNLQERTTTNETDISNLKTRTTTNETNITNLQGRTSTNETNITNLQGRTTTNETDITDLKSRVSTNESKHNYSTEEQVIGSWINGKPLYRKTFVKDINNSIGEAIGSLENIDFINVVSGFSTYVVDNYKYYVPMSTYENTNNYSKFYIEKNVSTNTANVNWVGNKTTGTIYGTVEYTKTTD